MMAQSSGIAIRGHVKRAIFTYKGTPSVYLNGEILEAYNYSLSASSFQVVKSGEEYFTIANRQPEKEYTGSNLDDRTTFEVEQVFSRSESDLASLESLATKYNISEADVQAQRTQIQRSMEDMIESIARTVKTSEIELNLAVQAQEGLKSENKQFKDLASVAEDAKRIVKRQLGEAEARLDEVLRVLHFWAVSGLFKSSSQPFHMACHIGSLDVVDRLSLFASAVKHAKYVVEPFDAEDTFTPMHVALASGHIHVADYLLRLDGDPLKEKTLKRGIHPILFAAVGGLPTLEWALSHGCSLGEVSPEGVNVAHAAAMANKVDVLRFLASMAPKLLTQASFGDMCPMHCAAFRGSLDALIFLSKQRGTFAPVCRRNGVDLHHFAASSNQIHILDWLHSVKFDLKSTDLQGYTFMHHAAIHGATHSLQWALEHHFDLFCVDRLGQTPLDYAKHKGVAKTVEFYTLPVKDPVSGATNDGESIISRYTSFRNL